MNFQNLFIFLRKLQLNNNKDWMDTNRKEYHLIRDSYIDWLDVLNKDLREIDNDYFDTPGKKAINRINNNLLYHPNRPTYKDHFGAGLDQRSKQGDFYIELGINDSFVGGGYWHPSSKILKSLRDAIDYNGSEFNRIINKESFKEIFGNLVEEDSLITAPRGFSPNHKYINLLRRKSFAVTHAFTEEEVCSADFKKQLIHIYKELLPFRRYLNNAVTV